MRTERAFVSILLLASASAFPVRAETPQELLEIVKLYYGAQRDAIESMEVAWDLKIGEAKWEFEWKISGNRFRISSLSNGAAPTDLAFDGRYTYSRTELGLVSRSAVRESRGPYIGTPPNRQLDQYLVPFLFRDEGMPEGWTFTEASRVIDGGKAHIRLVFEDKKNLHRMESLHDTQQGYMPVRQKYVTGQTQTEVADVQLQSVEVNGNQLFYPVYIQMVNTHNGSPVSTVRVQVKPGTLKLNRPIPVEEFVVLPYPHEELWDVQENRVVRQPTDAAWTPTVDSLAFPWNGVWSAATNGGRTPPPPGAMGIRPTPGQPVPPQLPPPIIAQSNSLSTWAITLAVLAAALAAGVALLLWRQRTAST